MEPLVSVVIPTYGRPDRLSRAVASVAEQTYGEIELIVVDDHSPTPIEEDFDISAESLRSVRVLHHERNQGASAARNTGIEAATGEFIAFLDDDDEWLPQKVERQVAAFSRAESDIGVVYTGIRQVNRNGDTIAVKTRKIAGDVLERILCKHFIGSFSAVMVRADVIEAAGTLDERFPSWQDWEWYIRLADECRFAAVPEPLVVRHNERGQISSDFEMKRDVSYELILEKYESLSNERFGMGFERKRRAYVMFELAQSGIQCGKYAEARGLLGRAIMRYPYVPVLYLYLLLVLFGRYSFEPIQETKRRWILKTSG